MNFWGGGMMPLPELQCVCVIVPFPLHVLLLYYYIVTLVRLSLVTNKGCLLTYLLTYL